jgi:hypothetical protein
VTGTDRSKPDIPAPDPKSRAVNREIADVTPLAPVAEGISVAPENMGQVMEFAKMMATAKVGVPKHLRDQPGVCLRVVLQASRAGLDPYDLATESFVVNDVLAYSAKAIHAMVMSSGWVPGRLELTFTGEGEELTCRVTGKVVGASKAASEIYKVKDITTRIRRSGRRTPGSSWAISRSGRGAASMRRMPSWDCRPRTMPNGRRRSTSRLSRPRASRR